MMKLIFRPPPDSNNGNPTLQIEVEPTSDVSFTTTTTKIMIIILKNNVTCI